MSKFQGDYTVGDMLRLDYSLWRRSLSDEEIQPMIEALKYAINLSNVIGKNISHWKMIPAFGTGDGVKITTNLKQINKALATYVQPDEDNELRKIIDRNVKTISGVAGDVSRRIIKAERSLQGAESSYREYCQYVMDYSNKIRDYRKKIEELKDRDGQATIIDRLRELSELSFFKYSSSAIGSTTLSFSFITDEVIINKGKDDEYNLGTYEIRLYIQGESMTITVHEHEGNTRVNGYWHPYVSNTGHVCWGDASSRVSLMLADEKLSDVFGVLQQLLTTYSKDTTPHMGLDRFIAHKFVSRFYDLSNEYNDKFNSCYMPVKLKMDVPSMDKKTGDIVYVVYASEDLNSPYITPEPTSTRLSKRVNYQQLEYPENMKQAIEWFDPVSKEDLRRYFDFEDYKIQEYDDRQRARGMAPAVAETGLDVGSGDDTANDTSNVSATETREYEWTQSVEWASDRDQGDDGSDVDRSDDEDIEYVRTDEPLRGRSEVYVSSDDAASRYLAITQTEYDRVARQALGLDPIVQAPPVQLNPYETGRMITIEEALERMRSAGHQPVAPVITVGDIIDNTEVANESNN